VLTFCAPFSLAQIVTEFMPNPDIFGTTFHAHGLAEDSQGNVWIAGLISNIVARRAPGGEVTVFAPGF